MGALLQDLKDYLGITWDCDRQLTGYIERGKARLNKIAGATLDYKAEGLPRALLFDYCRYANAQALEVFEANFQSELLALHLDTQAETVELEDEEDED